MRGHGGEVRPPGGAPGEVRGEHPAARHHRQRLPAQQPGRAQPETVSGAFLGPAASSRGPGWGAGGRGAYRGRGSGRGSGVGDRGPGWGAGNGCGDGERGSGAGNGGREPGTGAGQGAAASRPPRGWCLGPIRLQAARLEGELAAASCCAFLALLCFALLGPYLEDRLGTLSWPDETFSVQGPHQRELRFTIGASPYARVTPSQSFLLNPLGNSAPVPRGEFFRQHLVVAMVLGPGIDKGKHK